MSDQDSIDMISSRQEMGKETKCQLGDYWVIQNQNLLTDIIGIVQTLKRITKRDLRSERVNSS